MINKNLDIMQLITDIITILAAAIILVMMFILILS